MTSRHGTASTLLQGHDLHLGTSRFLSQGTFLSYRVVLAIYFLYWAIFWRGVDNQSTGRFLTHWTWYAATSYNVISAVLAFLCWRAMRKAGPLSDQSQTAAPSRPHLPAALTWLHLVLWSTASVCSLVVVSIFWGALYDGEDLTTVDTNAHIIVGIVMLVDQFLVADEFKLRYIMFAQAFGLIYIVFSIGWYYLAPKEDRLIYVIIDWGDNTLGACIYGIVCILVLGPLFGLLHVGIYRLRERIYEKRQARSTPVAGQTLATEPKEDGEMVL